MNSNGSWPHPGRASVLAGCFHKPGGQAISWPQNVSVPWQGTPKPARYRQDTGTGTACTGDTPITLCTWLRFRCSVPRLRVWPADAGEARNGAARQHAATDHPVAGRLSDGDPFQRDLCAAAAEAARDRFVPECLAARPAHRALRWLIPSAIRCPAWLKSTRPAFPSGQGTIRPPAGGQGRRILPRRPDRAPLARLLRPTRVQQGHAAAVIRQAPGGPRGVSGAWTVPAGGPDTPENRLRACRGDQQWSYPFPPNRSASCPVRNG